jgi:DNA polymerase I-like protein with 3'-5' exonuclease and polymerase domains
MHNGQHDELSFRANGIDIAGFDFDTLLAHAIIANQIPHDLGFVASCEYAAPRWKTEFRVSGDAKGTQRFIKAKAEDLRTYNAKDSLLTALLRAPLQKRLDDTHNGQKLFDDSMALQRVAMDMKQVGAQIDMRKYAEHHTAYSQIMNEREDRFAKLLEGLDAQ